MNNYHISVLLQKTIDSLHIQPDKQYIDATLGGGGHTGEITKLGGKVLGIDMDDDALAHVRSTLGEKVTIAKGNFKDIDTIAKENGFVQVAGILFDLGISSHHVDTAERGFSFQADAPLDMRMDQSLQVTAADLVNGLTKNELQELFTRWGEEPFAGSIARGISNARKVKRIETTSELAEIARRSVYGHSKIHPATRIFQALRIAVNDELNSIRDGLPKALTLLEPKGRMAVISFHSLEDRIVKQQFKQWEEENKGTIITKKPLIADEEEVEANSRSRSAKVRVFEKI
jgi:16S rRNA (cytosine1402-N4)-methyltransferase